MIASLARVNIAEREEALRNLPWTQTEEEKQHCLDSDAVNVLGASRNHGLRSTLLLTKRSYLLKNAESGARLCPHRAQVFEARLGSLLRRCAESSREYPVHCRSRRVRSLRFFLKGISMGPDGLPCSVFTDVLAVFFLSSS